MGDDVSIYLYKRNVGSEERVIMLVLKKGQPFILTFKTPFTSIYKKYVSIHVSKEMHGDFVLVERGVLVDGSSVVVTMEEEDKNCQYGWVRFSYCDLSRSKIFSSKLMYRVV